MASTPQQKRLASQVYVKVNGQPLQATIANAILNVEVDQHTHLPTMFTIRLKDSWDRKKLTLMDGGLFDFGKPVVIEASVADSDEKVTLVDGEITALEPEFEKGMVAYLVVRGYDKSHRMYRETKTEVFPNEKDSGLANTIAGQNSLSGDVDDSTEVHHHIFQANQTDLSFLMQRAWRIGYECFVDEGKLYFRKPPTSGSASVTLNLGADLLSFHPRMNLAEQVDEVIVRGWDPEKMQPIVGRAQSGNLYPKIGESKDGKTWASSFGTGKVIIVDQPVATQTEADALAQARLDELSGSFVVAEGEARRRPDIKAGEKVKLEDLGERLTGEYLVTQATHIYIGGEPLKTHFKVRGSRTGLLAEQMTQQSPVERWNGVVTAVVSNSDESSDQDKGYNWGRVKVKYPWLNDQKESYWARVIGAGGGPEAGFFAMPEVGDEVLVAFEHGDFNRPVVLGGLWNGKHKVPPERSDAAEQPLSRIWRSRTGHRIAMYDKTKNNDNRVEIYTAGGHYILIDDANKKVEIKTSGGHTITMDDQGKAISMDSTGTISLTAKQGITIDSKQAVNITGTAGIKVDGKAATVDVKGSMINLN